MFLIVIPAKAGIYHYLERESHLAGTGYNPKILDIFKFPNSMSEIYINKNNMG